MNVAQIILQQLGGKMFLVMTGASQLLAGPNYLAMKLPANTGKWNKLQITLNEFDTYDMEFFRIRKFKVVGERRISDVYFDQLQEIFTSETGLYTKL